MSHNSKFNDKSFSFFSVKKEHREIIIGWFKKEHVKEFYYGQGLENTLRNLDLFIKGIHHNGEYSFERWIAYIGVQPLGFLMTSLRKGWFPESRTIRSRI